jgi:hypothetical protein
MYRSGDRRKFHYDRQPQADGRTWEGRHCFRWQHPGRRRGAMRARWRGVICRRNCAPPVMEDHDRARPGRCCKSACRPCGAGHASGGRHADHRWSPALRPGRRVEVVRVRTPSGPWLDPWDRLYAPSIVHEPHYATATRGDRAEAANALQARTLQIKS